MRSQLLKEQFVMQMKDQPWKLYELLEMIPVGTNGSNQLNLLFKFTLIFHSQNFYLSHFFF